MEKITSGALNEIIQGTDQVDKEIRAISRNLVIARLHFFVTKNADETTDLEKVLSAVALLTALNGLVTELDSHRESLESLLSPLLESGFLAELAEAQGFDLSVSASEFLGSL